MWYLGITSFPRISICCCVISGGQAGLRANFVTPEDIQDLVGDILRHRIILSYEAESEGITAEEVVNKILNTVNVS